VQKSCHILSLYTWWASGGSAKIAVQEGTFFFKSHVTLQKLVQLTYFCFLGEIFTKTCDRGGAFDFNKLFPTLICNFDFNKSFRMLFDCGVFSKIVLDAKLHDTPKTMCFAAVFY
jgi:hypothetical protein